MATRLLTHLTALESAELVHLAQRRPELEYIFHHTLLQEVAYRSILHEERRQLHLAISQILEELYASQPEAAYSLLAYHYQKAAVPEKAREYLLKAAEQAASRYANEDAITYYSEALALLAETEQAARFDLLLAREALYNLLGQRPAQRQDLESVAALAEAMDDDGQRMKSTLRRASYEEETGNFAAAIALARQAVALAQATGLPAAETRGCLVWGNAAWRYGRIEEANEQLQRAYELARQVGLLEMEAESLLSLGIVAELRSQYQAAGDFFQRSLTLYRRIHDLRGESRCLNSLGVLALKQNQLPQADEYIGRALQLKRQRGDQYGENVSLNNLAIIAHSRHEYQQAQRYFEQCRQLSQAINDREGACSALSGLGVLALKQGDLAAARTYLEQGLQLARAIGDRFSESTILGHLAWLAYYLGTDTAARPLAQQALRIGLELDSPELAQQAWRLLGRILLHVGNLAEAADAYRQALQLEQRLELTQSVVEDLAGLAAVYLAQGEVTSALAQVEAALAQLPLAAPDLELAQLAGVENPVYLFLDCYRVLQAVQDERAPALLAAGYRWLITQADRLENGQRPAFLEKLPAHAGLLAAWYASPAV
jgi:tetratricopeptide (TPR) repeat protein